MVPALSLCGVVKSLRLLVFTSLRRPKKTTAPPTVAGPAEQSVKALVTQRDACSLGGGRNRLTCHKREHNYDARSENETELQEALLGAEGLIKHGLELWGINVTAEPRLCRFV